MSILLVWNNKQLSVFLWNFCLHLLVLSKRWRRLVEEQTACHKLTKCRPRVDSVLSESRPSALVLQHYLLAFVCIPWVDAVWHKCTPAWLEWLMLQNHKLLSLDYHTLHISLKSSCMQVNINMEEEEEGRLKPNIPLGARKSHQERAQARGGCPERPVSVLEAFWDKSLDNLVLVQYWAGLEQGCWTTELPSVPSEQNFRVFLWTLGKQKSKKLILFRVVKQNKQKYSLRRIVCFINRNHWHDMFFYKTFYQSLFFNYLHKNVQEINCLKNKFV